MKRVTLPILCLTLFFPALTTAEVLLLPHNPAAAERPATAPPKLVPPDIRKVDLPTGFLIVPFFNVDTTDPSGETTLFAVRNRNDTPLGVAFSFLDAFGGVMAQEVDTLAPRATRTINIRDIEGLDIDPDGFSRGLVTVISDLDISSTSLAGDFLQVDTANDFATGERMISTSDLCDEHEIRFVDFGSGTNLRISIVAPQGGDPDFDPPSVTVRAIAEDGTELATTDVYTDLTLIELLAADLASVAFGTLIFDFTNSSGGWVYGEYSAENRFSVGLNPTCTVPSS